MKLSAYANKPIKLVFHIKQLIVGSKTVKYRGLTKFLLGQLLFLIVQFQAIQKNLIHALKPLFMLGQARMSNARPTLRRKLSECKTFALPTAGQLIEWLKRLVPD